jgi:homoserine O-acetyltransferase/O-succinyltransferase
MAQAFTHLVSEQTQTFVSDSGLRLDNGAVLTGFQLAYRTFGQLNADASNAVLVCHALSGSADADQWWPGVIAAGGAVDPSRDFVVVANVLGSCYGSTGPASIDPATGEPYAANFPALDVADWVAAIVQLLDHLHIGQLKFALGASMGGMQVLQLAKDYPERVAKLGVIACPARASAQAIALNALQCQAIRLDPTFADGNYRAQPAAGLALARRMGLLTYRSYDDFEGRFGRDQRDDGRFQVESYLDYNGDKFLRRFDALSYLSLTETMMHFDLGKGVAGGTSAALAALTQPILLVSVSSDALYPPRDQALIAEHAPNVRWHTIDSPYGHDGFLVETPLLIELIKAFREHRSPLRDVA